MDPNRSSFNGLPPNGGNNSHNRQPQMPAFPYQFQNPQLANLGGMPQRGLNMHGLLQQQLDQRQHQHQHQNQHPYGDHRDLIAALARQNQNSTGNAYPQHQQHQSSMNFHQQHQHTHQQQQQQQQQQQGNMFFNGDQFHLHAQSQSQTSRHRSPFAVLQEEHERRKQQELKDAQARQFHDFLFSRKNGGVGPNAATSPTVADRMRSSSFISAVNSEEAVLSPRLRPKRSHSNVSDSMQLLGNQEIAKRLKSEHEDAHINMTANVPDVANSVNNVDIDLTSDLIENDRLHSEGKDSDSGVEFVGTVDTSTPTDGNIDTNGSMYHSDNLKVEEDANGTYAAENLHDNDTSTPPALKGAKDINGLDDGVDISDDSGSIALDKESFQAETGLKIGDESLFQKHEEGVNSHVGKIPNVSLLLEAAKSSAEPVAEFNTPDIDAMQILAEATEGRAASASASASGESNVDHDISDTNAAKLFASIKDIPVEAEAMDGPENESPKSPTHSPVDHGRKDPVKAMLSRLPELPSEPNYIPKNDDRKNAAQESSEIVPLDVKEPVYIQNEEEEKEEPLYYSSIDTWFPSNNAIKREKKKSKADNTAYEMKLRNGDTIKVTASMHSRLGKSAEPGVLDKLPHCKIHERMFQAQYGKLSKEPLFCCQVTEIYCKSVMLCCSMCNTWRHAECGGHHTFYSPQKREAHFTPTCDRCYNEKQLFQKYPQAEKRIARQRSIHLRKTHVTADIMRHAAYAKHGGTYKWPLGSVLHCNIGGHSRSVHIRHERSEKQWKEMLHKLNAATAGKRERVKQRTKELERVLNNLEEAEGKTDRHNMILFLQRDSKQRYPTGFEKPQLNFFDPEEDHVRLACLKDEESKVDLHNLEMEEDSVSSQSESSSASNGEASPDNGREMEMPVSIPSPNENFQTVLGRAKAIATKPKKKAAKYCIRPSCKRKPRFDSAFCSDACGVSVMETDLLRSLSFANNMHPYNLRS